MYDFMDRVPTKPNRKLITPENGTPYYATVTNADEPTENGTPLNRAGLMAMQGFEDSVTTFNPDGTITESFGHGATKRTLFNEDGSITESFISADGVTISKTTSFNEDGSITESLSV